MAPGLDDAEPGRREPAEPAVARNEAAAPEPEAHRTGAVCGRRGTKPKSPTWYVRSNCWPSCAGHPAAAVKIFSKVSTS
eukprot:m.116217 g.116217  ORF g.116217 m.116217 type:complete len:79 (+) comp16374_c0_seq2:548-784(+)